MTEREIAEQIVLRLNMTRKIKGSKIMCHCPYHQDKHPSCSVDLDDQIWHCFSCGQGGKLRALFRDLSGHSINKELGIPWEDQKDSTFVNPFKTEIEEDLTVQPDVHIALDGTFISVKHNNDAIKYLEKRCIPVDMADKMQMKFAAMAKSYDTEEPNNKDKWVYFTKRLVIPIYEKGKLMSCEGRDIYGEEYFRNQLIRQGKDPDKYEYKKCIYPRGASTSTLYDIDKLDTSKTLFFMEGIMDLAVLRTDPYFTNRNSTAVFGASISGRQFALLKKFSSTVFIIDNDLAGWTSLKRWKNYIKENNLGQSHMFILPPFTDKGAKDIGDVPVKIGKTITECREAKWLTSQKSIILNEQLIDETVDRLNKERIEKQRGTK